MSSPRINNTIIVGGLLIYVAVVFMCIDYAGSMPRMNNHICMVRSTSIQKILNKNKMAKVACIYGRSIRNIFRI